MKIFITGCAHSGTTLLCRLFYAFKDVEVISEEISLQNFINYKGEAEIVVGKRTARSIFSYAKTSEEIQENVELIQKNDIKIVNIVRDGRDVIESDEGRIAPSRWIHSVKQALRFGHIILCAIRYEDLVRKPDTVQVYIGRVFKLYPTYMFSEYPNFVPKENDSKNPAYKKRSITTDRIGKDLDLYKRYNKINIKLFEECLREWNYI